MLKRWRRARPRLVPRHRTTGRLGSADRRVGHVHLGDHSGLVVLGDAKLATLLVAADLIVSGFSAVQESEDDETTTYDPAHER